MKKRSLLFLVLLTLVAGVSFPQRKGEAPPAASIPDSLRQGADAVVRLAETTMTIKSEKDISYHKHYIITVLNKNGLSEAVFQELYNKTIRLNHFRGAIYDADGHRTEKISSSDLKDITATSGGTLYQDDRVKVYVPDDKDYPFTVEYEVDKEYHGTVLYPAWKPQDAYYKSVEQAVLKIIAPPDRFPRYESRLLGAPEKSSVDDMTIHVWRVSHLPSVHPEPVSADLKDRVPILYLAPSAFYYAHSSGNMSSWSGIGHWIAELNAGRQELPAATIQKIKALTAPLDTKEEKARAVYHYMQEHTRYVSVQLGIGGFQPYPASYVDENGYGDCKALCNYTCALMAAAGIDARYVLVKAGKNAGDILTGFPSNQFNHVIVSIPQIKDTIWLECTSQTQPFGFLGSFTADRHGLMICGDSGVLVHTPFYGEKENTQHRRVTVEVNSDGSATATIQTRFAGLQYENVEEALLLKGEELKKWYYDILDIPNFIIHEVTLQRISGDITPAAEEKASVTLKKYMTLQGERAFLPLNLMNKANFIPKQTGSRQSDIYLYYPFTDVDTIVWKLPEGFTLQYGPKPVQITSPFGAYESHIETGDKGRVITYIRHLTMKKGRYPKTMIDELTAFRKKIVRADRQKVILKKL
jgi:hypothetical protein